MLSLCKQICPDKIPELGERLGEGADGEVFALPSDPTRVYKLGIIYEGGGRNLVKTYEQIRQVLNYMVVEQPAAYARVYEHEYLATSSRKVEHMRNGKQYFIIHQYTMEKLNKISEDEKRVFHSILSHEDRGIEKNFSPEKIHEMLQGMGQALDFDPEKVTLFCDNIKRASVSHLDIHVRNIMKDDAGNFKLIDFDRIELERDYVQE